MMTTSGAQEQQLKMMETLQKFKFQQENISKVNLGGEPAEAVERKVVKETEDDIEDDLEDYFADQIMADIKGVQEDEATMSDPYEQAMD
jgi:hypothetical protein